MPYDQAKADAAVNFFQRVLRHTKGKFHGQLFELLKWQVELVEQVFGTVDAVGNRQYQTVYVEVPKKNGKSEMAAGIALYCLLADGEPGAEVYSAAASRDQAALVFGVAASMVEASPVLSKLLRVVRSTKRIVKRGDPDSFYRAISADGDTADGINPHCVIADELHRWKVSKALDLWEILERGTIARSQPLVFAITTAGVQDESPLCWRMHEYSRQVNDGTFEDKHFLGKVYGAEESDDWKVPAVWTKANPSLETNGGFLKMAAFEKEFQKALNDPGAIPEFKRFHLNIWGQREGERCIPMEDWRACGGELRPLIGRTAYCGVDLSATTDLTSVVFVFPADDGSYDLLPFFWMAEKKLRELEKRDKVPYSKWVHQGYLNICPGSEIDQNMIRDKIRWGKEVFELAEIDYDPWQSHKLMQDLASDGYQCIKIDQKVSMLAPACKELMTCIQTRRLRHGNHPVLTWNASCADSKGDGKDNYVFCKPDRQKSSKRIDGIAATVNALRRAMLIDSQKSVYENREVFSL